MLNTCASYNLEELAYLKLKIKIKLGEMKDRDILLSDTLYGYIWIYDLWYEQQFISPIINVEDKGLTYESLSTHKKGSNGI